MYISARILILILISGSLHNANAQDSFTYRVPQGKHAVGLRVVHQYDYTRTYRGKLDLAGRPVTGETARPIQTLIWHPAETTGPRVNFGDYFNLLATEDDFTITPDRRQKLLQLKRAQWDADPMAPMLAVRDAKPDSGRYPVVIYAPSLSAPAFENADLCEHLASHGYVVIASPDMGARTRGMTNDLEGAETQARDISFLIGFARTLPQADLDAVAVAGFSWGGISNLFAAARDHRIHALIFLDGSARYYPKLIEEAKYVVPENITVPLLYFTQHNAPIEELARAPFVEQRSTLRRLTHADVTILRMAAMAHGHFSSLFNRSPKVWATLDKGDYSADEVSESFGWVVRYTERFLSARFKKDPSAIEFLAATPAKNGVRPHLITVDNQAAKGVPATIETLLSQAAAKGFSHIGEIYAAMKAENKDFKLDERWVNTWGYDLLALDYLPEAVEVFKWNVAQHPDSFSAYDSLAEAYDLSGQKDLAIKNYEKSVELNPKHQGGIANLKRLRK